MKIFCVFFYVFLFFNLTAQNFLPLENSSHRDLILEMKELENGNFIYISTYHFPEDEVALAEVLTATDSIYTTIKLVDEKFHYLAEFPIKTKNSLETLMGWDIFETDSGYIVSGLAFSPFTTFRKNFIIEIDENFNEISRNIFAHAPNIVWSLNSILNFDGNLVFIGGYGSIPASSIFLAEYSLGGDLLNLATFSGEPFADDFVQLPDSSYRIFVRLTGKIMDLPADWSGFSEGFNLSAENIIINNNSNILLPDNQWLLSGAGQSRDPITLERKYFSQLVSVQPDSSLKVIYQSFSPDSAFVARGFRAMDMIDTSCIYFSNLYEPCLTFDYPQDSCFNFISIHNVHVNGTENWTQYLGFDATYYPMKILATQDEGVLLLVYRYNEAENLAGEGDMYFIKLDKEGNIDFMTGTDEETSAIKVQQFLVYPNPARDVLRFTYGGTRIIAPSIRLFDSAGRLVLEDQILDKETDISQLTPGNYFYKIIDQKQPVQTGKIIKQ